MIQPIAAATSPQHAQRETFAERTLRALARQRELCHDPGPTSALVLQDLLDQARSTSFGRAHGLGSVATLAQWKRAVPIRTYEELRPYVDRQLAGEAQVLTRSAPYAFLKTSGSSGLPKYIPTTRHWRERYRGRGLYAQWGLYCEQIGADYLTAEHILDLSWERTPASRSLHGFPVYSISRRPAAVGPEDWVPPWYDAPWLRGDDEEEYADSLYRKLRLLAGADVRLVVTLNPSKIVGLAEQLALRGPELVDEVGRGTVSGRPAGGTVADPDLARRLARTLAHRPAGLRLTDLWPRLSVLVCWNSASAGLYRDWLDDVTPGIRKLPFSTTGTEGIVTIPVDDHPSAGPLAADQGVFEFVPCQEDDDGGPLDPAAATLDPQELETGRSYRLVMSQANGLYRYDVGDVYTVLGRVGALPRLEFAGRAGFGSSFTGEKLTEAHVYEAVRTAHRGARGTLPMFTCIPSWGTPPGYVLAVEWDPQSDAAERAGFTTAVEAALQDCNPEYAEKRRSDRLRPLRLLPLAPKSFLAIAEAQRRKGAAAMQIKHHWIQNDDTLLTVIDDLGLPLYG
ncbi:GH3 auxin-responsive promoter family protein [Streptomyces noursei]|uniref:GH3 auxin-responsive promoter family protein n=1 Tax=Streptomyces TaxID=1883 RepID=UPI001F292AAC|nr:GH3 auxin-responsive promoter family protein [Streptomyces noursei]MCE4941757.1 GH3 auxin-responsive promoter family protein [Streptomyces noursei]